MDAQTIVSGLIAAFALGALVGAVVYEVWVAEPLRRVSDVDRVRLIWAQARERHLGTPYIDRPGLRVVNGEPLYSADWLSDKREASA